MERKTDELIELGVASAETKGPGGLPFDIKAGQNVAELVED